MVDDVKGMTQRELEDHLDALVARGEDAEPTAAFTRAYEEWESRS